MLQQAHVKHNRFLKRITCLTYGTLEIKDYGPEWSVSQTTYIVAHTTDVTEEITWKELSCCVTYSFDC